MAILQATEHGAQAHEGDPDLADAFSRGEGELDVVHHGIDHAPAKEGAPGAVAYSGWNYVALDPGRDQGRILE